MTEPLDPGAYIGQEPERQEETIPGGVKAGDERIAAHDAAPGVRGEPDDSDAVDRPQPAIDHDRESDLR